MKNKKKKKHTKKQPVVKALLLLLIVPFVLLFVIQFYLTQKKNSESYKPKSKLEVNLGELPDYAYSSGQSLAGYKIAVRKISLLKNLKCHCNCEAMGMANLSECFIDNGAYNDHASFCDICINEALDANKWESQGVNIKEIIKRINKKYARS